MRSLPGFGFVSLGVSKVHQDEEILRAAEGTKIRE